MAQSELAIHVPVEVLATQLDITDSIAKSATIEELFKTAFIPTDRHSEYSRWMDELRILKHCGRAIGPKHVGKSRSSINYREEDLKKTLETIELDILALPQASNLWEGRLFEILRNSTQSRIGILIEILSKTVLHSLRKGHGKVDEGVLNNIANRYGRQYVPLEVRNKPPSIEGR